MEGTKTLQVRISEQFSRDLEETYQYGIETFGLTQAQLYEKEIWELIERLTTNYLLFPECHHLITKSRMYRWIILDAHSLIYRLQKNEIQVLRLIHARRSINQIKAARSVRM